MTAAAHGLCWAQPPACQWWSQHVHIMFKTAPSCWRRRTGIANSYDRQWTSQRWLVDWGRSTAAHIGLDDCGPDSVIHSGGICIAAAAAASSCLCSSCCCCIAFGTGTAKLDAGNCCWNLTGCQRIGCQQVKRGVTENSKVAAPHITCMTRHVMCAVCCVGDSDTLSSVTA